MNDYSEALFQSIDTIIAQRLRNLPYDRTIVATITDNSSAYTGLYKVTTDDYVQFTAYSTEFNYAVGDRVYVRIPAGDYTQQKVIVGRYVAESVLAIGNTKDGFYYKAKEIPAVSSSLLPPSTLEFIQDCKGYDGFGLAFKVIPPEANPQNNLTISIKVDGMSYIDGSNDYSQTYTLSGSDIVTNYPNVGDGQTVYVKNINFPLNDILANKITVSATSSSGQPPVLLDCDLTLGYLLPERINAGQLYLLLYNDSPLSIYYVANVNSNTDTGRKLNIKLLKVDADNATVTQESVDGYKFIIGVNDETYTLVASPELEGRYKILANTDDDVTWPYPVTLHPSSKTTAFRVYLTNEMDNSSYNVLSNILYFYSRADTGQANKIFTIETEQDTFYLYGLDNKLLTYGWVFKDYPITLKYDNKLNPNDTLEGAQVIVKIPTNGTMLQDYFKPAYQTDNTENHALIFDDEDDKKSITGYFRIKDYYTQSAYNNTIEIEVIKDGQSFIIRKELLFGNNGTQGNDYIINTWITDSNDNLVPGLKAGTSGYKGKYQLYNYANEPVGEPQDLPEGNDVNAQRGKIISFPILNDTLVGILPVPIVDSTVVRADVPTTIVYDITGKRPVYYKDAIKLYNNDGEITGINWTITAPENATNSPNIESTAGSVKLIAPSMYQGHSGTGNTDYVLKGEIGETLYYQCELYIGQNKYYTAMINKETNQTSSDGIDTSENKISYAMVGRAEPDNSRLYMAALGDDKPLGLYAYTKNKQQLFGLTGNSLQIAGREITLSRSVVTTGITALQGGNLITITDGNIAHAENDIGDSNKPVYVNDGTIIPMSATVGDTTKPIYSDAGTLTAISSLNEELVGFNSSGYGFSSDGKNTKLYAWLKAIQTNINNLKASGTSASINWPGNTTL